MTKTENYQLNQWEPADPIRRTDFNADNAAIDAAIKAVADTAASKASAESVSALSESVNSQITALAAALGSGGKTCRIAWGSYTGNGKYGSANPTKLTPGFCPVAAMVGSPGEAAIYGWPTTMMRNCTRANGISTYGHALTVAWEANAVSWYGDSAEKQMNQSGTIYYYVVFGYDNG